MFMQGPHVVTMITPRRDVPTLYWQAIVTSNLVVFYQAMEWRICVTVPLPVRRCGEKMHWQANVNTPLCVSLLKLSDATPSTKFSIISCLRSMRIRESDVWDAVIPRGNQTENLAEFGGIHPAK